jgi:hypothetical protein
MKYRIPFLNVLQTACSLFFIIIISCSQHLITKSPQVTGPGFEGTVFEKNGTPVYNAQVCIYKSDYSQKSVNKDFPYGSSYSAFTDKIGKYRFKKIRKGTYSLIIKHENNWIYHDSILLENESVIKFNNDTLREKGVLICKIQVKPYATIKPYSLCLPGTPFKSNAIKGIAVFKNIPAGNYSAVISTPLEGYKPSVQNIKIKPGLNDTFRAPLELPLTGIPAVEMVSAVIDTASGAVRLNWHCDYKQEKDFLVFRRIDNEKSFGVFPRGLTQNREFTDTIFSWLPRKGLKQANDTTKHKVSYFIRIRNKAGIQGPVYDTVRFETVSQAWVTTFTSMKLSADTLSINDKLSCTLSFHNRTRPLKEIVWYCGRDTVRNKVPMQLAGNRSAAFAWKKPGTKTIIAESVDNAGVSHKDSACVVIIQDPPVPSTGKDTVVGLNDPIHLHGKATQRFGTVVKWEWSFGGSDFVTVSRSDTDIISPPVPMDSFKCILRVTDDDNNSACDTMNIKVISIPPETHASGDTLRGLFEPISIGGHATDNGRIVSYEWDIGGNGKFIPVQKPDTQLTSQKVIKNPLLCVLRATDDDGEKSIDTVKTKVALLWGRVSSVPKVPERNSHSAIVHNNSIWIIGGRRADVWNSSDGKNWNLITSSAPFGNVYGHGTVEYKGKIWIVGGKKDDTFTDEVWSSPDGKMWELSGKLPFTLRQYHATVVFKDKIMVLGGLSGTGNYPCLQDIWESSDGKQWDLVTDSAGFQRRYGLGAVAFHDSLFVIGGYYDGIDGSKSFSDVWGSSDGKEWRRITEYAGRASNSFRSYIVYDDRVWAIGGYCREGSLVLFKDVLFSYNCRDWTRLGSEGTQCEREFTSAVVFRDKMWVIPSDPSELWYVR